MLHTPTSQPLFIRHKSAAELLEKQAAAVARMPDDDKRWPAQVLSEMHKQLPFLSKFDVDIELTRVEPEAGYALGFAMLRNKTGKQRAAEELGKPTNKIRVPVIVADRLLQPFHVFEVGGKTYPLTQERVESAMMNPAMFDGISDPPGTQSLLDQIYPPFQHRQGYGMMSGDRATVGLSKLSSAPRVTKTASGEPGPLREFLRQQEIEKVAVNLIGQAAGQGIGAALRAGTLVKGSQEFLAATQAARAAKAANPALSITRAQSRALLPRRPIAPGNPLLNQKGVSLRTPEQGGVALPPRGLATAPPAPRSTPPAPETGRTLIPQETGRTLIPPTAPDAARMARPTAPNMGGYESFVPRRTPPATTASPAAAGKANVEELRKESPPVERFVPPKETSTTPPAASASSAPLDERARLRAAPLPSEGAATTTAAPSPAPTQPAAPPAESVAEGKPPLARISLVRAQKRLRPFMREQQAAHDFAMASRGMKGVTPQQYAEYERAAKDASNRMGREVTPEEIHAFQNPPPPAPAAPAAPAEPTPGFFNRALGSAAGGATMLGLGAIGGGMIMANKASENY